MERCRPIVLELLFLDLHLPTWNQEVVDRSNMMTVVLKHVDVIDALTSFYDKLIFTFLVLKQAYYSISSVV